MSERERAGLERLLHELEEPELPAPELLARHATDPNGLDPDERLEIERAIARSPAVVDELDTLRGFDPARLDADRVAAGAGRAAGASWLRGLLRPASVWVAAAAAAVLVVWLLARPLPDTSTEARPQLVEESGGSLDRGEAPELPETPVPDASRLADAPDAEGRSLEEGAVAPSPESSAELPLAERRPTPPDAGIRRRPSPKRDESQGRGRTAPGIADDDGLDDQTRPRAADEGPREVLIAMAMPTYRPAFGTVDPDLGEWVVRADESAATVAASARVSVVSPLHVTRVLAASPPLFWSLDRPATRGDYYLSVLDSEEEPIVLDVALPRPKQAGLQRIDLAHHGVQLPKEKTLRWSVAHRAEPEAPPTSFDFGWVRRASLESAAAARLEAAPASERAALLAAAGAFNEALAEALAAREARPDDPARAEAVARLLEAADR